MNELEENISLKQNKKFLTCSIWIYVRQEVWCSHWISMVVWKFKTYKSIAEKECCYL